MFVFPGETFSNKVTDSRQQPRIQIETNEQPLKVHLSVRGVSSLVSTALLPSKYLPASLYGLLLTTNSLIHPLKLFFVFCWPIISLGIPPKYHDDVTSTLLRLEVTYLLTVSVTRLLLLPLLEMLSSNVRVTSLFDVSRLYNIYIQRTRNGLFSTLLKKSLNAVPLKRPYKNHWQKIRYEWISKR